LNAYAIARPVREIETEESLDGYLEDLDEIFGTGDEALQP
jgi:hypothetical protein